MREKFNKFIKAVLVALACMSLIMVTAEAETASLQVLVSGASIVTLVICAKLLDRMGFFGNN